MQEKGKQKYSSSYWEARNRSYHQIKVNGASSISFQCVRAFPSSLLLASSFAPNPMQTRISGRGAGTTVRALLRLGMRQKLRSHFIKDDF